MLNGLITLLNSKVKSKSSSDLLLQKSASCDLVTLIDVKDPEEIEESNTWSSNVLEKLIHVLVIDRDDLSVHVLESMFKPNNVCFKYDPSLIDAVSLERYLEDCVVIPNLIVLDICVFDALQIVKLIRQRYSRSLMPILLSATSRYESLIYECLDLGANDFIYKPFRYKELNYRVSNLLQLSKFIKKNSILSDILPTEIIENLEHGINFMAKYHPNVTILFSDICSFTKMSCDLPTKKMILLLNTMFCGFDDICLECDVYKVETIGDSYMIASGHDGKTDHVDRMIQTGIRMLEFMKKEPLMKSINIRIGIHTGCAHSGVIGKIRPRYCFFGDTVNTASRMESHGVPNAIQISDDVYKSLSSKLNYTIQSRGKVDIKGKGAMTTYLISG